MKIYEKRKWKWNIERRSCIPIRVQQVFDLDVQKMLTNNGMYRKPDSQPLVLVLFLFRIRA